MKNRQIERSELMDAKMSRSRGVPYVIPLKVYSLPRETTRQRLTTLGFSQTSSFRASTRFNSRATRTTRVLISTNKHLGMEALLA